MIQYAQTVNWDSTLIDVEFLGSEQSVALALRGLACRGVKTTAGAPSAVVGHWIPGAEVQNAVSGVLYINNGSTATPSWGVVGGGASGSVQRVIAVTNGTTPVNVFGNPSGVGGVILSVSVTALDVTAGNIIVKDTAGTVATVAKGTVIGVTTGATAITNATFTPAGILTIESSSAGNATVTITYTQA